MPILLARGLGRPPSGLPKFFQISVLQNLDSSGPDGQDRLPYEKVPYKALKCSNICLQLLTAPNCEIGGLILLPKERGEKVSSQPTEARSVVSLNSITLVNTYEYQTRYKFKFRPAITLAARDKLNRLQAGHKTKSERALRKLDLIRTVFIPTQSDHDRIIYDIFTCKIACLLYICTK